MAASAAAAFPGCGVRRLNLNPRPWLLAVRCSASSPCPSPSPSFDTDSLETPPTSTTSAPRPFFPKRGQTLELVCETLAFKGKGVCKTTDTNFVLMCDRALPGERFLGRVSRKKPTYAEVTKLKTITPHHDFVEAPCEYASHCGGCKTQNLLYEAQIRAKEQQVRDLIVNFGRFNDRDPEFADVLKPIVPCEEEFHYRNKMEFSFGAQKWVPRDELAYGKEKCESDFALGLHAPGFFDKVVHIEKCLLQSKVANKVLAVIQENWMDPALSLSPYDVHKHTGFLKHLMLRSGRNVRTGLPEVMVNFVTSSFKPKLLEPLVDKIRHIPEVVSVVNNVNTSVGNTSVGEEEYTLYGKSTITEMLRGLTFQISANSFFQTNSKQAEVLYKLIESCAGLRGDGSEIILDLFCGTGTIGLSLARRVKHVYGYEVVPEAISDARINAELNGIHNATFVPGDLNKINDSFGNDFPKPDIIISDPNRPGMHMKLIKYLLKIQSPRIVYVSCNPATCARDLDYLCHGVAEKSIRGCYRLKSVIPVDMFPHTPHIECVQTFQTPEILILFNLEASILRRDLENSEKEIGLRWTSKHLAMILPTPIFLGSCFLLPNELSYVYTFLVQLSVRGIRLGDGKKGDLTTEFRATSRFFLENDIPRYKPDGIYKTNNLGFMGRYKFDLSPVSKMDPSHFFPYMIPVFFYVCISNDTYSRQMVLVH